MLSIRIHWHTSASFSSQSQMRFILKRFFDEPQKWKLFGMNSGWARHSAVCGSLWSWLRNSGTRGTFSLFTVCTTDQRWGKALLTWWRSESWEASVCVNTEPQFLARWNQTGYVLQGQMTHLSWKPCRETDALSVNSSSFGHLFWV